MTDVVKQVARRSSGFAASIDVSFLKPQGGREENTFVAARDGGGE